MLAAVSREALGASIQPSISRPGNKFFLYCVQLSCMLVSSLYALSDVQVSNSSLRGRAFSWPGRP
jgi:hypothetical protein